MRRLLGLTIALACFALVLTQSPGEEKTVKSVDAELTVGQPIQHGNLTIFRLSSRVAKAESRFITLDDGLKAGSVRVMEVGSERAVEGGRAASNSRPAQQAAPNEPHTTGQRAANARADANPFEDRGADVNHLWVLNRSKKPLYLMPGEIIIGGQQDRTIAQEYVIEPSEKPAKIEVFCVEHGRWQGRGEVETAQIVGAANAEPILGSNAYAGGETDAKALAGKASKGEFIGSLGNVNKRARVAVQASKDQGEVWNKVAEVNAKSANASQSGDFAGNYANPVEIKQLAPYVKAIEKPIADQPQIVGVVVAIDGKMDTLDVFESTPLFRQLWPKLLKSYALDAANAVADEAATKSASKVAKSPAKMTPKSSTLDDARRFVAEAMSAKGNE